eukprot:TRINITY_DN47140_c0_g1_i1.p1 TRINITY_DN47140_c0_g1~~TRINITY_DN47140_c0_g1_i1.p1  ORF type:complete len:412 (+),score=89.11 TRINITY_DN47140_c0_g1_i1:68-1237(+)
MYVGAWQEYKIAKAVMASKLSASDRRPPSSGSARSSSFGLSSAHSAPVRRAPPSPSSSTRSAMTDAAELAARELRRPRPVPGVLPRRERRRRVPSAAASAAAAADDAAERRRMIQKRIAVYTGAAVPAPACPHCRDPSTRFCSSTGQPHAKSAASTPRPAGLSRPEDPPPAGGFSQLPVADEKPGPEQGAPGFSLYATAAAPAGLNESVVARLLRAHQPVAQPAADAPVRPPSSVHGVGAPPWRGGELYSATISSARCHGDVLSPGGCREGPPPGACGPPLARPAQRPYRDAEEQMLLLSQSAKQYQCEPPVYHTEARTRITSPPRRPPRADQLLPRSPARALSPAVSVLSGCSGIHQGEVDALLRWTEGLDAAIDGSSADLKHLDMGS